MATLGQIKTKIWQEMEVNSDSTTYSGERLKNMINEVSREIAEGKVSNELSGKYIQGNILPFLKGKMAIQILSPRALEIEIDKSSQEIYFDTKDYPESGYILIGDEVIRYTSKQLDRIEGVSGILSDHRAGATIRPLYRLERDFWKPLKMYKIVEEKEIEIVYKDNENNLSVFYEIKDGFLLTYGLKSGDTYYLEYVKFYEDIENDTDYSIFPEYIAMNIIPFIVGGRLIKDEDLRIKLLSQGYNKIATEYAKQSEILGKPKKVGWKRFGFNSIR